jgi:UDP-N-acetylmuramate--alanine ligase
VLGYDKTPTPLTQKLTEQGIDVHFDDRGSLWSKNEFVKENTLVVYTPAVPTSHAELCFFQKNSFEVLKRSEVLGLITRETFCLAVAGTHGKTTTSSILAHLLKETNAPMTAFLGGVSEDFNDNFFHSGDEYSVVEADEFDRSFLRLSPNVACVTSIDADHLDIYGNEDSVIDSFKEFVSKIKQGGTLIYRNGLPFKGISYGIEDASDYCIKNILIKEGGYQFDITLNGSTLVNAKFNKPGRHNLLNGLAAFAMAHQIGKQEKALAEALNSFKGVERRFSYRLVTDDFVFIDDYAHHPAEIEAVYQAVQEFYPEQNVVAVFQPHLFSRTRDFADDFARVLSKFNAVLLLDIYPAREEPMDGVTSEWLLQKIQNPNKKLVSKESLVKNIKALKPQVLVVMGAGDIGMEIPNIKKKLEDEIRL